MPIVISRNFGSYGPTVIDATSFGSSDDITDNVISGFSPIHWLIDPPSYESVKSVPKEYWKLDGDTIVEMTDEEKKEKDVILLDLDRKAKLRVLEDVAQSLFSSKYSTQKALAALALMIDTFESGDKPNRRKYIRSLFDWANSIMFFVASKQEQLLSAKTREEVANVSIDVQDLLSKDPKFDLIKAISIEN